MTMPIYAIPAVIALLTKVGLLAYAWRSPVRDNRTSLFVLAVITSLFLNILEIATFLFSSDAVARYAGYLYYAALLLLLSLLCHLTVQVTFENLSGHLRTWFPIAVYGYAALLLMLLAFTSSLISGFEWLGGYTPTRIAGPLFWLVEAYSVVTLLTILLLPLEGLHSNSGRVRSRCQIWMLAAAPSCLLIIVVLVLLHWNIRWFNASVTLPIPMALLLTAIAYCLYSRRVFEPAGFVPFSRIRRIKEELYAGLHALQERSSTVSSVQKLLADMSETLECPVWLIRLDGKVYSGNDMAQALADFPRSDLQGIQGMVVSEDSNQRLRILMSQHRLGAIVSLFPHSETATCLYAYRF
jgi:hypothetical protein